MDQNLNNERIVGFLGQSYVLIPRKVLEMLFRGEGRERSVGMVYLALFSEAGKDAPEQSAFLSLEEAERRMGGRSMQFDCCTADGEGGLQ